MNDLNTMVNVVVLDLHNNGEWHHEPVAADINEDELSALVSGGPPPNITKRLYLVEEMTVPVIRALWTGLRFDPEVFASHMEHYGRPARVGHLGAAAEPLSRNRRRPYFSLPFRRKLGYTHGDQRRLPPARRRTIVRDYNTGEKTAEERITGALYTNVGPIAMTG